MTIWQIMEIWVLGELPHILQNYKELWYYSGHLLPHFQQLQISRIELQNLNKEETYHLKLPTGIHVTPQGIVAMSTHIFSCHNWKKCVLLATHGQSSGMLLTILYTAPHHQEESFPECHWCPGWGRKLLCKVGSWKILIFPKNIPHWSIKEKAGCEVKQNTHSEKHFNH